MAKGTDTEPAEEEGGIGLEWKILIGIVAGLALGIFLNATGGSEAAEGSFLFWFQRVFEWGGGIFVRLLRMLIVPLVFASIFMAIANLGDLRELGKLGRKTVIYYFTTTALAVLTGLILVLIVHPGRGLGGDAVESLRANEGVPETVANAEVDDPVSIIVNTLIDMIPTNSAGAFADGNILQIIFFTIFLAAVTAMVGKGTEPMVSVISGLELVMNRAVWVVMVIAPYAIFMLVTSLVMEIGFDALRALSRYALVVLVGLLIHAGIVLPALVFFIGRYNPIKLFRAMLPAIMTAWSTASSAATLPVTMEMVEERAGVDPKVSNFVLPLGATVNMDGTALYESVAVIFIAELLGIDLTIGQMFIIFITATLAAIGAAAIPGAGLITMGIVLTAVGLPLEGIGLILAIDRILDQFRTAVNVWGDSTAAVVVGRLEDAIDDSVGKEPAISPALA